LLLERTGGLLDQLTGGGYDHGAAEPDDDDQGHGDDDPGYGDDDQGYDDDDEGYGDDSQGDDHAEQGDDDDGHESPSAGCQSSGQASTWWSGSARSSCS
jgi:hypothetical protein